MTIQTFNTKNKHYSNISYLFYASTFTPTTGYLNYALLNPLVCVSAVLQIKEPLINDYKNVFITLAFKQVKSKQSRNLKSAGNILYFRKDLKSQLDITAATPITSLINTTKILLLNDSKLDTAIGDAGIQCMFRFEKHDGSSEFYLEPGAAFRNISSMIGLGVFDAENVESVLDNIIQDMVDLVVVEIIPNCGISLTTELQTDISSYLHFCFYGEAV